MWQEQFVAIDVNSKQLQCAACQISPQGHHSNHYMEEAYLIFISKPHSAILQSNLRLFTGLFGINMHQTSKYRTLSPS